MKAIGFRAEPSALHWGVVEGTPENPVLVAADTAEIPVAFDEPEALAWVRGQVLQLIKTYSVGAAAVRYPETFKRSSPASIDKRCRIEGVVIEAARALGITALTGALATISKNLGSSRAKKYLESDSLRGLDWSAHPKNQREAILVAASALK